MSEPLFLIRPFRPSDERFVVGGWHASNRYAPASQGIRSAIYDEDRARIAALVERSHVSIATAPDNDDALFGFAVWQVPEDDAVILHYVYVKRDARRLGIARALLSRFVQGAARYSHLPVIRSKLPIPSAWEYRPWFMRGTI